MCDISWRSVSQRRMRAAFGDARPEHVRLRERHAAGVLHRAGRELGHEELVVLAEHVRVPEALLEEVEALPGELEELVGIEVLDERLPAVDAQRDAAVVLVDRRGSGRPRSRPGRSTSASVVGKRHIAALAALAGGVRDDHPVGRSLDLEARRWLSGRAGRSTRTRGARHSSRTGCAGRPGRRPGPGTCAGRSRRACSRRCRRPSSVLSAARSASCRRPPSNASAGSDLAVELALLETAGPMNSMKVRRAGTRASKRHGGVGPEGLVAGREVEAARRSGGRRSARRAPAPPRASGCCE